VSQKSGVAPIKDSAIGLLSPKLTPNPESMPGQDSGDFTRNSESTNYNNCNDIRGVDSNLTRDTCSPQVIIWQGASPLTNLDFIEADYIIVAAPSKALNIEGEATTPLKRKYIYKVYKKTRLSARNRALEQDKGDGDQGGASTSVVFTISSSTLLAILIKDNPA
jgi:hypothetical protein